MSETTRCCELVAREGGWGVRQCVRTAKVTQHGKAYCGQHDPERVKERQAASDARYREKEQEEAKLRIVRAVNLLREHGYTVIEPAP